MEIHLPVHQPPCTEEMLDVVDAFFFYHQLAVYHIQHGDDAVGADEPFPHTGKEAVAVEIVQPIHIELGTHHLMKEFARIGVLKNPQGHR